MKKYRNSNLSLVDALTDRKPQPPNRFPSAVQHAINQVRQLTLVLFDDKRQKQQHELNTAYDTSIEKASEQRQQQKLLVAVTGFGLATVGMLLSPLFYLPSIACTLYVSTEWYQGAWHSLYQKRRVDYHVIYGFIITALLLGGFIWASAFAVIFSMLNRLLVAKTEQQSKANIANLFGTQLRYAWVLVDGIEVETPFHEVKVGDIVVVHAGQPIPVDGLIIDGNAIIDQHMLTGESQPIEKGPNDTVFAMTLLLSGYVHIQVEKAGDTTVASQIGEVLSQTTNFKQDLQSRTEQTLNRMILPLLTTSALALPWVGIGGSIAITCYYPGARMMLFGPLSMLSYLQVAAQKGILIKDGRALEVLHKVDTVVFDKTGTLTLEQPTVSQIYCYSDIPEHVLLRYAAAVEAKQSHPIAKAILQATMDRGLELPQLLDAHYEVGFGIKAQIEGYIVRVGSMGFMKLEEIPISSAVVAQQAESHALGNSFVLVAIDGVVAGAIEMQPTIRPEAREIIQFLHHRGIETVIISGDNEKPTYCLADELGVGRYFAEVLPEDKAHLITQLQNEGRKVCFVGDGINDSIALKTANVAVSLRGATTIATDLAEIVFMNGTLQQLPDLFELASDFDANMNINMFASVVPGIVGIAGTLLLGWGVTTCVLITQANTPIGIYNALRPLLAQKK